jgi:DNA-binding CsgD family transcriptional regulator
MPHQGDQPADPGGATPTGSSRSGGVVAVAASARLLERERELSDCAAALDHALAGSGGVVVIQGPAGIGKTEVLRAVAAHASAMGALVLAARGHDVERELAFGGVRQLLDPVFRTTPPAEAARLLSGSATPARRLLAGDVAASSPAADPFAMMNALYWVFARLADGEPLVLLIDDAHWLDPPSLRLVDFLLPRVEELPVLVVVAARPPETGEAERLVGRLLVDSASRVIRLGRLSRAAVAEFVHLRLGEQPDPEFVDACADVTAGNPFYLTELLRELALQRARPTSRAVAVVRTIGPRSIPLALRFRDARSSDRVAVARAVAVLGDGAGLADVAALAGLERAAAASAADTLTRTGIFAAEPELAFAHPIVRTAVYGDLEPRECALAHARAARILHVAGAPVERVANHLLSTQPAGDPWAVEVLRAAATTISGHGAPESAVQHLRRALAEPPEDGVRAAVLLELARAEAAAAEPDAATHFADAYALADDVRTRADAAEGAAYPLAASGRMGEAVAMLAALAEELEREDADRAFELEARIVALAMNEPSVAQEHLPRLGRIDEDLPADSRGRRLLLCHLAYQRMWRSENAARAAELAERALQNGQLLAEAGSESPELNSAAMTLICADRLEPATKLLDAALAEARERGTRHGFAHVSFLRSVLAYRRGALREVEADDRAMLAIALPSAFSLAAAVATGMLIGALLERGALDEATEALRAIGLVDGEVPTQTPFNLTLSARGRLRLARGDLGGGLADLHECGRRNALLGVRNPVFIPWRADAVLAHRARGEVAAARALAEEELDAACDWDTPGAIGAAQRVSALLREGDDAIALLRQAVTALADSPARLEHARALVDLGAALRRANHRREARDPLTRGLDLADRCGATVLCARAREELAAMGVHRRRSRLTGVEALTGSERRVAQMAARGLSNVDIAQTLFVTRKTVEKHLSNAYMKLGVNSRTELIAHFPEQTTASDALRRLGPPMERPNILP